MSALHFLGQCEFRDITIMFGARIKAIIPKVIIAGCSLFILFVILEVAIRIRHKIRNKTPFFADISYKVEDPILGWRGSKVWGDPASPKKKIFFVGDSFTVPQGKHQMYFEVIKKELGVEVFVHGGCGYGSLQEYLVIDRHIDEIKPDLLVLQVCSNDFINNLWELERRSFLHNNYKERPYYEGGQINYRFPCGPVFLRKKIILYSRLFFSIMLKIDILLASLSKRGYFRTIEADIEEKGVDFAPFRKSIQVTAELIEKIQRRCGSIPIIAFSTFDDEPYFSQFKEIFQDRGIDFLEEMPSLVWYAETRGGGIKIRNYYHWTELGHIACGKYLADYINADLLRNRPKSDGSAHSRIDDEG